MSKPEQIVAVDEHAADGLRERALLSIRAAVARMSTGTKLLLLLSVALLPLGLIAVFASIDSARSNREARSAAVQVLANDSARSLTTALTRSAASLRAAATALTLNRAGRATCARTIARFDSQLEWGRFAVFGPEGRLLCASANFEPDVDFTGLPGGDFETHITDDGQGVRLSVPAIEGGARVVAEFPRDSIVAMTRLRRAPGAYEISLTEGRRRMVVSRIGGGGGALDDTQSVSAPAFNNQLSLDLVVSVPPVRAIEVLLMVLPILMWLFALLVGWLVVNGFVLRPLGQLQRAIAAYKPGDSTVIVPAWTPAVEIRRLAAAFAQLGGTVARHEADLEAGLARQTRLTREVHHRVKNNLQVVASLIHLHARGVTSEETEEAYKSILRRVDALAIVHRNHYAELDESRGVAVRSLLGELAANLRATAGPRHARLSIHVEVDTVHATQDNAVAIAFLFTEAAELAMLCDPVAAIAVSVRQIAPDRALLTVSSPALRPSELLHDYLADRFGRVFEGLSRQLRSKLQRDEEAGAFAVEVAVIP